ncbi:MAG: urease accessory protein UreE [Hyphomicrobiales bacterium]
MRAARVIAAGTRHSHAIIDTVILDFEQRQSPRGSVTGTKGTQIEIALAQATRLRTDDLLVLEDGNAVEVVAQAEPLIEARAADLSALARLAWHLGDRHVPVEVLPNRIRVRRDPAIETLLKNLGAKIAVIEAPFEPEGGAYAAQSHGHAHDHAHDDSCGHDHHHHGHQHHKHD